MRFGLLDVCWLASDLDLAGSIALSALLRDVEADIELGLKRTARLATTTDE